MKKLASLLIVSVLIGTLAGCGGGGGSSGSTPNGSSTTGVATPASVSIVTAK